MINFTFNVDGQKLECTYEGIVADSIKYLNAVFNFSDEWEGLQKYVHFTQGTTTYDMIIIDDKITAERGLNISEGMWHVSLHGSILEDDEIVTRITTNVIQIYVEKSGVIDGDPFPDISPTIGEQIIAQATEKANAASESATSANTSKTAAETAAQTATTKAGDASTYASQALAAKNEAAGSAQTASAKAGEASASAIAAAASAASCEQYDDTEIRGTVDELGRDVTALYEGIANKLTKPTEGIAVGKYFRVASIDSEGNPVLEACDLPMASIDNLGVTKAKSDYGTTIADDGIMRVFYATNSNIDGRTHKYRPIVPYNLDYATKSALSAANTSANAWSDAEKANACQRLGAYNPNKEWVLKGTLNTDNKSTGITVDMTGCREILIKGWSVATGNSFLNYYPGNNAILSDVAINGNRTILAHIEEMCGGFIVDFSKSQNLKNSQYVSSNINSYNFLNVPPSLITKFLYSNSSVVTECNIEIYAR